MEKEKILISVKDFTRGLRLPFVSAGILPFVFGSLISRPHFSFYNFLLGLISVIATHLGANLVNDYADSRSGVDWQDRKYYNFFGGSKLIQEGKLSEKFYLFLSLAFFALALFCVTILSLSLKSFLALYLYLIILLLGWSYSEKPLQLSYRRLGEVIIFLLFGPAVVMGGYFIQTRIFPDLRSFLLSLPFGLLTTAILFANEIPDYPEDSRCGKINWVSMLGQKKAYIFYFLISFAAFLSIILAFLLGYVHFWAIFSLSFLLLVWKAAVILKSHAEKEGIVSASKLAIAIHTLVSIILISAVI